MDKIEIGKMIMQRRKQLEINQETLADLAQVGINTVVAIERGQGNPKLDTLFSILQVLGLSLSLSR